MKIRTSVSVLVLFLVQSAALAQQSPYNITKTAFSTDNYDEFAPFFYGTDWFSAQTGARP
jgi:hypothetical protein